ncbi:MAG: glutamine amidotransferase [Nitrososphaerota archaeon]
MSVKVLFVGESLVIHRFFDKGVLDFMIASSFEDEGVFFREALRKRGVEVHHIPTMEAAIEFPENIERILEYDVVVLSDVGSNTLLLHPEVFMKSKPRPNRLKLIREYVIEYGKGFLMIGGYLSFQGLHGIARYKGTPIEEILPVGLLEYDDRVEVPEGFNPKVSKKDHPIIEGLPETWPTLLGYNKTILKKNATMLAEFNGDPILAVWETGKGRTAAFTSDCAPHWGTYEFLNWKYYDVLWERIINWLAKKI